MLPRIKVQPRTIVIPTPDDFHWHPRRGPLCRLITPMTAAQFGRALAMGNIPHHPIRTPQQLQDFEREIRLAAAPVPHSFDPIMGIMLCEDTTPDEIDAAYDAGAIFAKLMRIGVSHSLGFGVGDLRGMRKVFQRMARRGMRLSVHGETPGIDVDDAEQHFFAHEADELLAIDGLFIIFEHLTTAFGCDFVDRAWHKTRRVFATITGHHPVLTKKDWVSDKLYPQHFCKPTAKTEHDRDALIERMISGKPCYFFGSDSAAHTLLSKGHGGPVDDGCSPGILTAPILLQLLATIFTECDAVDYMPDYLCRFGAEAYGLPRNRGSIVIEWCDEVQIVPLAFSFEDPHASCEDERTVVRMPKYEQTHWKVGRYEQDP